MKNELTKDAVAHIVERPRHLDLVTNSKQGKLVWLAETLKLVEKTKALCYDEDEFGREFSTNKTYISYMKSRLKDLGIVKPRIVKEGGKVWIWKND